MDEASINEYYHRLVESVSNLNVWLEGQAVSCKAYKLPIQTDHIIPEYLDVEYLSGQDSLAAARAAYAQFEFDDVQDARTIFRLPGLIVVPDENLLEVVSSVNDLKETLKSAVFAYESNKHRRSGLCNRLFPKLAMNQVYRRIVVLGNNTRAVRFTWSPRTVGTKRMSPTAAISFIDSNIEKEQAIGHSDRVSALGVTRNTIMKLNCSSIVYCRTPVPPHPRANIVYKDGSRKMLHANLPFIASGLAHDIDVGDLGSFDVANKRSQRSDTQNLICLHEGLNLYVNRADAKA